MNIIYILGSSRSGSTYLDKTLNQYTAILSLGEILNISKSGIPHAQQYSFWQEVLEELRTKDYTPQIISEARKQNPQSDHFFKIYLDTIINKAENLKNLEYITDSTKELSFLKRYHRLGYAPVIIQIYRNPIDIYQSHLKIYPQNSRWLNIKITLRRFYQSYFMGTLYLKMNRIPYIHVKNKNLRAQPAIEITKIVQYLNLKNNSKEAKPYLALGGDPERYKNINKKAREVRIYERILLKLTTLWSILLKL